MKTRLNKIIAQSGVCSRRKADELILAGKVSVNSVVVRELGMQIDLTKDNVSVNNTPLKRERLVYIILNKPKGYITTVKDKFAEKTVFDLLPKLGVRLFPVGRLDKDTEGLLLLTNDGALTQKLLHPKFEIERVYEVTISGKLLDQEIQKIEKGRLEIDDYKTSPCRIKVFYRSPQSTRLKITLAEGKKREIRKIFASMRHTVTALKRVRFGNIELGDLASGKWEYIKKPDII